MFMDGRFNIVKKLILSKLIYYKFNATLSKVPTGFWVKLDRLILKYK